MHDIILKGHHWSEPRNESQKTTYVLKNLYEKVENKVEFSSRIQFASN